jgi:hypothetical protein
VSAAANGRTAVTAAEARPRAAAHDVGVALPLQLLHPLLGALESVLRERRGEGRSVLAGRLWARQRAVRVRVPRRGMGCKRRRTLFVMSYTTIAAAAPR